ncbi:hypothetical protein DPEC_G00185610 [Dallia pectoralis]|uniref:Uncharacterized protein n=1 Tax=Dallia pectoralis TaxID=75939 RepID=A0ACC2GBL9_DALPE|nr:hypothetical protein DPEC_G00185610 [Dallia pectoralis]
MRERGERSARSASQLFIRASSASVPSDLPPSTISPRPQLTLSGATPVNRRGGGGDPIPGKACQVLLIYQYKGAFSPLNPFRSINDTKIDFIQIGRHLSPLSRVGCLQDSVSRRPRRPPALCNSHPETEMPDFMTRRGDEKERRPEQKINRADGAARA